MTIGQLIARAKVDLNLLHDVIHGAADAPDIMTESGPVPTFAKRLAQLTAEAAPFTTSDFETAFGELPVLTSEFQANQNQNYATFANKSIELIANIAYTNSQDPAGILGYTPARADYLSTLTTIVESKLNIDDAFTKIEADSLYQPIA